MARLGKINFHFEAEFRVGVEIIQALLISLSLGVDIENLFDDEWPNSVGRSDRWLIHRSLILRSLSVQCCFNLTTGVHSAGDHSLMRGFSLGPLEKEELVSPPDSLRTTCRDLEKKKMCRKWRAIVLTLLRPGLLSGVSTMQKSFNFLVRTGQAGTAHMVRPRYRIFPANDSPKDH